MLGKAVKVRHCPATVSAPALEPVVLGEKQEISLGFWCEPETQLNHWKRIRWIRFWEGG